MNSYAKRALCTVFYSHPDTFEVVMLENDDTGVVKRKLTEKEKYERKIYLDKIEVVMTYLKIQYHRSSDVDISTCTPSKLDERQYSEIIKKVNDSDWLKKNGY